MDRGTARTFVSLKVEDPSLTKFSATQYNNAIDLAEEQFALDTRCLRKETTLTTSDGVQEVAVPTDFIVALLVRHDGLKLRPVSRYELSFQHGDDWTADTGTPIAFYIDEEDEKIGFYPKPDAANSGANVTLNYVALPVNISSDSTVLLNAKALLALYHPAVVAWAAHWMLSYLKATPEILLKQSQLIKEYTHFRDQAMETYNNMADEPPQMKGGRHWQDRVLRPKPNAFT